MTVLNDSITRSTASIKYGSRTVILTNKTQIEFIVVPFMLLQELDEFQLLGTAAPNVPIVPASCDK